MAPKVLRRPAVTKAKAVAKGKAVAKSKAGAMKHTGIMKAAAKKKSSGGSSGKTKSVFEIDYTKFGAQKEVSKGHDSTDVDESPVEDEIGVF